jgi:hypothetical protein
MVESIAKEVDDDVAYDSQPYKERIRTIKCG